MTNLFPTGTTISLRLKNLRRSEEERAAAARLSTRLVKSAAVLPDGAFLGWQMEVPPKGLVRLTVFGSQDVRRRDLEWIAEDTGELAAAPKQPLRLRREASELYELSLPAAEQTAGGIGFGAQPAAQRNLRWPTRYSAQFRDLICALQETGAVFRAVVGPAEAAAQERCRKVSLRTLPPNVDAEAYLGRPVAARFLLRLPEPPSIRLRTVLSDAAPGAALRAVTERADELWASPLSGAPVLPECAARVLLLEPQLRDTMAGVVVVPEPVRSIPASHRNPSSPGAVTIGSAVDTAGIRREIKIGELDLKRHYQIVGQTGTGKSTLLANLILSAIRQGHGLTFLDPHGTTVDVVLRSLPRECASRVRVVRLGDKEHPVPLNIWDSGDPEREERNISDLCELFADIFNPPGEVFVGPRYERWLSTFCKLSLALLGRRASLESIAVISQSKDNMLKACKKVVRQYPALVETVKQEYGLNNSSEFQDLLGWLLCKFQRLISVEQLRKTLGGGTNALRFSETVDTDTVTLVDLAMPELGTPAARIAGTFILMKLWNAVLSRRQQDRLHLLVVDESALFQTNPMTRMLAEGRKFGLSLVLCHQHTGQLSQEIRDALEANSANFSAFRLSTRDAATAAIRLDEPRMQTALPRLDAFRAVTTLSVDGRQTPPFTLEIRPPRRQADGEQIAAEVERRSIRTLVEPYEAVRALTAAEIQQILNREGPAPAYTEADLDEELMLPDGDMVLEPEWLTAWKDCRGDRKAS